MRLPALRRIMAIESGLKATYDRARCTCTSPCWLLMNVHSAVSSCAATCALRQVGSYSRKLHMRALVSTCAHGALPSRLRSQHLRNSTPTAVSSACCRTLDHAQTPRLVDGPNLLALGSGWVRFGFRVEARARLGWRAMVSAPRAPTAPLAPVLPAHRRSAAVCCARSGRGDQSCLNTPVRKATSA